MLARCLAVLTVLVAGAVAWSDEVVLTTGEVLKVTNVKLGDGVIEMDHPILGHLRLPSEKITSIRTDEEAAEAAAKAPAAAPGAPPVPPAPPAPAPEKPRWKTKAELGINGTSGNTRSNDLRAAIDRRLETDSERWVFDGVYLKSRQDGETTVHNWYVEGLHDWLFKDSPWLLFVTGKYDWDQFKDYDKRVQIGGGVGYKLVDDDCLKIRARAGFNETREYGGEDDSWRPEGLLGLEGSQKINGTQDITASVIYYPDIKDPWKYRLVSEAAWSIKLNDKGLSMKVGATDEIDSHRKHPEKKSDLKYFVALLYEF
jgi:putative salt-induced outer membrane protein YdiY